MITYLDTLLTYLELQKFFLPQYTNYSNLENYLYNIWRT